MNRLFYCIILMILLVGCGDKKPLPLEEFPYEVQKLLHFHYPYAKATESTVEGFFSKEYEVTLDNLVEATFDAEGKPIEMKCAPRPVPVGILNPRITDDLAERSLGAYAVGFEIEDNGDYKIYAHLLSNQDVEFIYNSEGEFLKAVH